MNGEMLGFALGFLSCFGVQALGALLFARWVVTLEDGHTWAGGDPPAEPHIKAPLSWPPAPPPSPPPIVNVGARIVNAKGLNEYGEPIEEAYVLEPNTMVHPSAPPPAPPPDPPRVGDVWVHDDGEENVVTRVEPPNEFGNDWRIALDAIPGVVHIGWWYGQGWTEKGGEDS